MIIGNRTVGDGHPPLIIGELSGNHGGSLDRALKIVDAVAAAGAEAIKLQTYTADTMTLDVQNPHFVVNQQGSPWNGRYLHDLYEEAHTPWEWHEPIFERAKSLGLLAFSSPFDETSVDFLEERDVPCYKIASFEITDLRLIRRVAATGKPMIVSTGMATRQEIEAALAEARKAGCTDIALLRCTSSYPAEPASTDLLTMTDMRSWSACQVGLSDHTLGIGVAVAAVALGATIIEKHVFDGSISRTVDSSFSATPRDLRSLVTESRRAWQAIGRVRYGATSGERTSLKFRRSLFFTKDLDQGTVVDASHMKSLRPHIGIGADRLDETLGKTLARSVRRDDPVMDADFL